MTESDEMTLNVVIATYNRAQELEPCLEQLRGQAFRPGDEVVVADNGSTDGTAALLERLAASYPVPLRVVREPRPGKSWAVTAAVAGCRADVLAFTDDDVIVGDAWVARIHEVMARGDVDLLAGRVLPRFAARVPAWLTLAGETGFGRLASPLALLDYGDERQDLGPRTALGANLVVRRRVFLEVGGYSPALGKLRGTLLSGEDHQLCEQVQARGYHAVYEPSVAVGHLVPADRLRFSYYLRWFFWSGVTHAALQAGSRDPHRPPRLLRHHLGQALVAAGKAGLYASRGAWSRSAEALTWAGFSTGYAWSAVRRTKPSRTRGYAEVA